MTVPGLIYPEIGNVFPEVTVTAEAGWVASYTNSTGDWGFSAHQARIVLDTGQPIAPPTLLDTNVGARLAALRYESPETNPTMYGLHAKQEFRFENPLIVGQQYTIAGRTVDVYERNGIKYFTIEAVVSDLSGQVAFTSGYTRAFEFPGKRHPTRVQTPLTVPEFLTDRGFNNSVFPNVGSMLHGRPRVISQELMNLYSGPGTYVHTSKLTAKTRGLRAPIAQALMITSLENELFREAFGLQWYRSGEYRTRYIRPIPAESEIWTMAVVKSNDGERMELACSSFNEDGVAMTITDVAVRLK